MFYIRLLLTHCVLNFLTIHVFGIILGLLHVYWLFVIVTELEYVDGVGDAIVVATKTHILISNILILIKQTMYTLILGRMLGTCHNVILSQLLIHRCTLIFFSINCILVMTDFVPCLQLLLLKI